MAGVRQGDERRRDHGQAAEGKRALTPIATETDIVKELKRAPGN